jgi:hypothetical protein
MAFDICLDISFFILYLLFVTFPLGRCTLDMVHSVFVYVFRLDTPGQRDRVKGRRALIYFPYT